MTSITRSLLFVAAAGVAGVVMFSARAGMTMLTPPDEAGRSLRTTMEAINHAMSPTTPQSANAPAKPATPALSRSGWNIASLDKATIDKLAAKLAPEDVKIILNKGTEPAFCGTLLDNKKKGVYIDRLSGLPLFRSDDKFDSGTGWPSFFQPYDPDHIVYEKDTAYGMTRIEIIAARSGAHLGHVFDDGPQPTGLRYCLNSASLEFVEANADGSITWPQWVIDAGLGPVKAEVAYFGGGCFWGLEERFQDTPGVIDAVSGYMGGQLKNPTYKQVCNGDTGHAEVVKVVYDPSRVSYEALLKSFFRYHDPTQLNRQGPDYGTQYRSAIYGTPDQIAAAKAFIHDREHKSPRFAGKKIVTEVAPVGIDASGRGAGEFYKAEPYHQDYNERTGHQCYVPMCEDE